MAKKIVWSIKAQNDRKAIFSYWNNRNKSTTYSKKLNLLFQNSVNIIAKYPELGKLTSDKTARVKVVNNYLIFYEVIQAKIVILTIWDSRQNPKNLEL